MRDVHTHLSIWMRHLGMTVNVDAAGNLRGVYAGVSPSSRRLFIGSHLDTVPRAGAFDGVLGVVLALAMIDSLNGERLPFAIEAIGFSDEEGVRFGVPFIGSRAFIGTADDAMLARRDARGQTVRDAIVSFGLDPTRIDDAVPKSEAIGYLEFHIEQGPVLDNLGLPIGVVDAIAGQTRVDATFIGTAGHAGTTPMTARRDALAGAAEWIAGVERHARSTPGLVATVGRIEARPGAGNVIAGACNSSLDVRHATDSVRIAAVRQLEETARRIARSRSLDLEWAPRLEQPACAMDGPLVAALDRAVRKTGIAAHHMPSGAGHDAMIVAERMPAAMLFLRSPGGLSHHPDESVVEGDVALAIEAGGHFLRELTREPM